jgi:hypothetical protein
MYKVYMVYKKLSKLVAFFPMLFLEKPEALAHLDAILEVVDGVMVARGAVPHPFYFWIFSVLI